MEIINVVGNPGIPFNPPGSAPVPGV